VARIEQILRDTLTPHELTVVDDGHRHRGHAGAASGAGHFNVRIVADAFRDKSRIARHRLVYDALREELGPEIHALSVKALTPEESE
jgi:BolA protein